MKERPILFSAPMVQAILAGNKTQTRRVVKMPDYGAWDFKDLCWPKSGFPKHQLENFGALFRADKSRWIADDKPFHGFSVCPYGQIGDQLWVRETFSASYKTEEHCRKYGEIHYRADCDEFREEMLSLSWTPSIHMPRWASRIQLEITNIRVERLQDISEADAWKEGVDTEEALQIPASCGASAVFSRLWESINGHESWDLNPWVWVIEFKRVERAA